MTSLGARVAPTVFDPWMVSSLVVLRWALSAPILAANLAATLS